MYGIHADVAVFLFLSIGAVAVFSFVSVAVWSDNRRKERVAYYKNETLKKIAEAQGGPAAIDFIREQEKIAARRQLEGMKLGGLVTAGVGIAVLLFLRALLRDQAVYLAGLFPLLVGVALLIYSYFLAPQESTK